MLDVSRRFRSTVVVALFSLCLLVPLDAQTPPPIGNEFQVNTTTSGNQTRHSVSGRSNGEFIVSWLQDAQDVVALTFGSDGVPVSGEFVVDPCEDTYYYRCYSRQNTATLAQESGSFVVVWGTHVGPFGGYDYHLVRGERVSIDGSTVAEFPVNYRSSHGDSWFGALGGNASGDFVVVWDECVNSYGYPWGCSYPFDYRWIEARRYKGDGTPDGPAFAAASGSTDYTQPDVAMAADGRFVVVWQSDVDGDGAGVFAQRFEPDTTSVGQVIPVNQNTSGAQGNPRVAVNNSGAFLVVWQSDTSTGPDTDGTSIQGRWFDDLGNPLAPDFQINGSRLNDQTLPAVTLDTHGNAFVTWQTVTTSGDADIMARRVNPGLFPVGPEFRVNTTTAGDQKYPSIGFVAEHDFVIVWQSSDGDGMGLWGQRLDGAFLFADGFESGDTSAW